MEATQNYLRYLVYFAKVDRDFHRTEQTYIREVAKKLGLSPETTESIMKEDASGPPPLPSSEVLRFILLDDLLNLLAIDGKLTDSEIAAFRAQVSSFGYDTALCDPLVEKLKSHIAKGFERNSASQLIKKELAAITVKNQTYEKYN